MEVLKTSMILWWKKNREFMAFNIFLCFTVFVYAPFEMYITNRNEFWFSARNFWYIPLGMGVCGVAMICVIGKFLKDNIFLYYEGLVLSAGLCAYLQGNFLSLKIGIMNGEDIHWGEYKKPIFFNLFLWGLILIIVEILLVKCKSIRRVFVYIACVLTAMQMVSLLIMNVLDGKEIWKKSAEGYLSEKSIFENKKEDSVIILLLDAFDNEYMKGILQKNTEIEKELQGFTYYSNSTGSYSTTLYSLLYLTSGIYNFNQLSYEEWRKELSQQSLYWDDLENSEIEWQIYSEEDKIPESVLERSENWENVALKIGNISGFTCDLYRFVACKYLPDIMKVKFWMTGTEFENWKMPVREADKAWNYQNSAFANLLDNNDISVVEEGKNIKFIHLEGAHMPFNVNEKGEYLENGTPEKKAEWVLSVVMEYFEKMGKADIYDGTNIIIMADHGYTNDGVLTNPVFLVKPAYCEDDFGVSDIPVSHGDFVPTIFGLLGIEHDEYGKAVWEISPRESRGRRFYQYYYENECGTDRTLRLIEYVVDDEGNARENFHLTDIEYTVKGEQIEHSKFCKLCQEGGPTKEVYDMYDPPRVIHEKSDDYPD